MLTVLQSVLLTNYPTHQGPWQRAVISYTIHLENNKIHTPRFN